MNNIMTNNWLAAFAIIWAATTLVGVANSISKMSKYSDGKADSNIDLFFVSMLTTTGVGIAYIIAHLPHH